MYFVESGELECFKTFVKRLFIFKDINKGPKLIKKFISGDYFGELALLYNSSRQATIISKSSCILWSLDRDTFNHIIKEAAMFNLF